jgi:hypothetical protein
MFNSGVLQVLSAENTSNENTTYFKASILFNETDNEIAFHWRLLVTMGKGKELKTPERKSAYLMLESMSKMGFQREEVFPLLVIFFKQIDAQWGICGAKSIASMLLF